jgi:ubiquitin C-terminal hydrolase
MNSLEYDYDIHKHYKLSIKKNIYVGKGLCGLINLGNKCFLNSIFQCLSNTLKFTDYLLAGKFKEDDPDSLNKRKVEYYLLMSYLNLINNVWDENQLIKPKSFVENLSKFHPKYFTLQQQDSHECLLYILDILHKSLSYEIEVEIKGDVKSDVDILVKDSLNVWKNFYENEYSEIIKIFNGMIINDIKCLKCNNSEKNFEPYNTLSISLPEDSTVSLDDCLKNYFEQNETVDTWKCEKCNNKGCLKDNKLWTIPDHLIIHLKRFKKEENGGIQGTSKINSHVNFPLTNLNITQYLSPNKQNKSNYIYDCYAINYHGGNINGGHYWSACKNLDKNWYCFNDADISKYSNENLENQLITKDAYILFYNRKMIREPKIM